MTYEEGFKVQLVLFQCYSTRVMLFLVLSCVGSVLKSKAESMVVVGKSEHLRN